MDARLVACRLSVCVVFDYDGLTPCSFFLQIKIIHRDITKIRDGGAPTGMDIMVETSSTSRPSSPTPLGRDEFTKGPSTSPRPTRPQTSTIPSRVPDSPPRNPSWGRESRPTFGSPSWGRPSFPPNSSQGGYGFGGGRWNPPNRWNRPGRESSRSPPPEEWTYI